jgi:hypothetical protein
MLIAIIVLSIYSVLVTSLLAVSATKGISLEDQLEDVDATIDDALEVLEEQHKRLEAKSKIEVFSDEPIVKELVQDIATARDSVTAIARVLDQIFEDETDTNEKDSTPS